MDMVRDMNEQTVYPFDTDYKHFVVIEVAQTYDPSESSSSSTDYASDVVETDRLFNFIEIIEDQILDGVVSHDEKQLEQLWFLREGISNSTVQYGYVSCWKTLNFDCAFTNIFDVFENQTLKYDISLPASHYYQIVEATRELISKSDEFNAEEKTKILPNGHGHVGDGNLHLNVVLPGYDDVSLQERAKNVIEPFVMDYVRKVNGSISAEHGVGQQKPAFLHYSKSHNMIQTMATIKKALDPNHILNPYKVLPSTTNATDM